MVSPPCACSFPSRLCLLQRISPLRLRATGRAVEAEKPGSETVRVLILSPKRIIIAQTMWNLLAEEQEKNKGRIKYL